MLGPAQFLLYINDVTMSIHSQLCLFAKYRIVYQLIKSNSQE